mmetsp:Transcript_3623/g.8746  ORF Transcript_3623/g.8746 Transcript_3623/m.8746 type:complete len:377 (-) Transcript_3623:314-1444(-)
MMSARVKFTACVWQVSIEAAQKVRSEQKRKIFRLETVHQTTEEIEAQILLLSTLAVEEATIHNDRPHMMEDAMCAVMFLAQCRCEQRIPDGVHTRMRLGTTLESVHHTTQMGGRGRVLAEPVFAGQRASMHTVQFAEVHEQSVVGGQVLLGQALQKLGQQRLHLTVKALALLLRVELRRQVHQQSAAQLAQVVFAQTQVQQHGHQAAQSRATNSPLRGLAATCARPTVQQQLAAHDGHAGGGATVEQLALFDAAHLLVRPSAHTHRTEHGTHAQHRTMLPQQQCERRSKALSRTLVAAAHSARQTAKCVAHVLAGRPQTPLRLQLGLLRVLLLVVAVVVAVIVAVAVLSIVLSCFLLFLVTLCLLLLLLLLVLLRI